MVKTTRRERRDRLIHSRACSKSAPQLTMLLIACACLLPTAALAASATKTTSTADAQALLTHYKCYICHADRETKAGPAYIDVARSLRDRKDAVSILARTIRRGMRSGGPWHMPPHPEVSAAEARTMARYIMSLRD